MKRILIPALMLIIAGSACAQKLKDADVPAAVKTAFAKQFPAVRNPKWSKENESEFEAEFKSAQGEQSANFDTTGKWLGTETEISEKSLPAAVMATIKKEFAGFKIEESEKAETPDGSFFEVELEKGEKIFVAQIAADGTLLKKEEEKEEKKD